MYNDIVLATSMRNVIARISAINHLNLDNKELGLKAGDIVTYKLDELVSMLDEWASTKKFKYYIIEHNEDLDNIHYHLVMSFASPTPFKQIKNKIPYGDIEKCRYGVKNAVQYLVHLNNPEKATYEWEDVITNAPDTLEEYKIESPDKITLLLDMIATGQIREYEIPEKISPRLYSKFSRKIKIALDYQQRLLIKKSTKRNINIVVLMGPSRVGKTTYCRAWAEKHGKSYCLSGGSRDVWNDYRGEDIFIYDDSDFSKEKISDLLKVFDPHNNSSNSSRYNNKFFLGDTIFICTNTNVTEWFKFTDDKLREALFKRIAYVLKFNDISDDYVADYTVNNIIYSDEEPLKLYDNNGNYIGCSKYRKLECADGETHYFDLKPYIDISDKENKRKELLDDIVNM